jgi:hypothetical protein
VQGEHQERSVSYSPGPSCHPRKRSPACR